MVASRLNVLWHKIVLSSQVWFLLEVVAKKPWKWSLYSSLVLTSFLPILVLTAFTVGSVLSGLMVLLVIQCGLLTLVIASFLSSVAVLVPVAVTVTLLIYVTYELVSVAVCAVRWLLTLPKLILGRIKQQVTKVFTCVSGIPDQLCFWTKLTGMQHRVVTCEVRSRAAQRKRQRTSPQYSHSETGRGTRCNRHIYCRSKGWLAWLFGAETDSDVSDRERSSKTCRHGYEFYFSRSGRKCKLGCDICSAGRSASSSSSEEDTIKFTSGSGSDYHTADEWLIEDYSGNIIPDYRDRESKMYEALLKMDFCTGHESNYWLKLIGAFWLSKTVALNIFAGVIVFLYF